LAYSHHCENADDATTNANGTCGCSDSGTYKSWTVSGATYDNSAGNFYDGAYALKFDYYAERAVINTTGSWVDLTEKGSFKCYYKPVAENDCFIFTIKVDDTHCIKCYYVTALNVIRLIIDDGSGAVYNTGTDTIADNDDANGWCLIQFAWDLSGADGTDIMRVKVGAQAWQSITNTSLDDIGANPTSYTVGNYSGADWSTGAGWFDAVQLYTSDLGA
jgi:hypothetical protein